MKEVAAFYLDMLKIGDDGYTIYTALRVMKGRLYLTQHN